jgi:putative transposase
MPRANRYYAPGYVWHITHRCHKREFLLKFSSDRDAYRKWLYEARKRFGLCVLNYMITCNHVHLLAIDNEKDVISKSMQLAAGRTGQDYNERKGRNGAFWEDRYHATMLDTQDYLWQCMLYIDCQMVRAGVVSHPSEWQHSGYNEIVVPVKRYRLIDHQKLVSYFGFQKEENFLADYRERVSAVVSRGEYQSRDDRWSGAVAVGNQGFLEGIREKLGIKVKDRKVEEVHGSLCLKEPEIPYGGIFGIENGALRGENGHFLESI